MNILVSLAIISGLSLNPLLQLGLGMGEFAQRSKGSWDFILLRGILLFLMVILFWILFTYVFTPLSLGFLEYFLLFPLTALALQGIDRIHGLVSLRYKKLHPPRVTKDAVTGRAEAEGEPQTLVLDRGYQALIFAALFFTLRLAESFKEALVLSLGFSLGNYFSVLLVRALYKRSALERLPRFLQGISLLIISMGLLALLFSAVSEILLHAFRFT